MAWNGSDGKQKRSVVPSKGKPLCVKKFISFAILVISTILGLYLFNTSEINNRDDKESKRSTVISEYSMNTDSRPSIENDESTPDNDKIPVPVEDIHSVAVTNGCIVTYPNDPKTVKMLPRPVDKLPFETFPDNEIASILSIKPGDVAFLQDLPRDFDQQFAKSLLTKIVIDPDDDDATIAMKNDVREVRSILAQAVKNGESPREILMEERKRLHDLMGIRDNYIRLVREKYESGASDQEVADIVDAANMMLERYEIAKPIQLPVRTKIRLSKER